MRVLLILAAATVMLPLCAPEPAIINADSVEASDTPLRAYLLLDAAEEPVSERPAKGVRSWSHLKSRSERSGVSDWERDVIMSAGADHKVPSKFLYGIWSAESNRVDSGWHHSWLLAKLLPRYGSECARRYRITKCRRRWKAVQRICAQKRNGQPICDPNEVRCSRAIALGPTQHLSTRWSPAPGEWGSHVVDYDNDGVYDPHSLTDAMASSAVHLRNDYVAFKRRGSTEKNAWRYAVRMYLGSSDAVHYQRKVYRYARNWCAIDGYCE